MRANARAGQTNRDTMCDEQRQREKEQAPRQGRTLTEGDGVKVVADDADIGHAAAELVEVRRARQRHVRVVQVLYQRQRKQGKEGRKELRKE